MLKLNPFSFFFVMGIIIAPYSSRIGSQQEFKALPYLHYLHVPELAVLCNSISMVIQKLSIASDFNLKNQTSL